MSDGPNGARGGEFADGESAACFPAGVALGATFDPEVVEKVGAALGDDLKSKSAQVLLGESTDFPLKNANKDMLLITSVCSSYY